MFLFKFSYILIYLLQFLVFWDSFLLLDYSLSVFYSYEWSLRPDTFSYDYHMVDNVGDGYNHSTLENVGDGYNHSTLENVGGEHTLAVSIVNMKGEDPFWPFRPDQRCRSHADEKMWQKFLNRTPEELAALPSNHKGPITGADVKAFLTHPALLVGMPLLFLGCTALGFVSHVFIIWMTGGPGIT